MPSLLTHDGHWRDSVPVSEGGMADIALSDVRLRRGEKEVLKGISFAVPDGKVVSLLGPSGSGKSTLLRAIAGLEQPHAGSIRIGDQVVLDAANGTHVPAHRRGISFQFQSNSLWPKWTAFDNVAYCAQLARAGDIQVRTLRALELAGALDTALRHPAQLTAAEQRRVTFARALVSEAPVLLLDDPLSQLDHTTRAEARTWLRALVTGMQVPVVIATRDPLEAMALADRVVLINEGAVEQEGTAETLYKEPTTLFAFEYMGQSNRLEGTLVENAGTRAFIEVMGCRIGGVTQTRAAKGAKATGVIRIERTMVGGGPGANRIPMQITSQMCLGERWELVFVRDALTVRAYTSNPLRHVDYHVEFPPDALWVF
jgi:iron(III) transport system ATP-binding protein